jgi:hypothetical protein
LALDVLRAVTQPIEQAQNFSFKARVSEEDLASNGQIVTFFRVVDVTVERPGKVHLIFRGRGERVDFFNNGTGNVTMYAPDAKLYTTIPAKTTIGATLDNLNAKGVDLAIGPFLRSDLYKVATANMITGYVIGRVKIFDQDVHQLAFTSPDADWHLWVTGGEAPRIVRAETVNKKLEGKPRTIVQLLDWNLNPTIATDEFTFTKPDDAHQVEMLPTTGGNEMKIYIALTLLRLSRLFQRNGPGGTPWSIRS